MSDDLVKRARLAQFDTGAVLYGDLSDRIAELEAKLAKAVEALEKIDVGEGWAAQIARTTLAELTGGKDE